MKEKMYVVVRESKGVVASHSDLELIKKTRLEIEEATNDNCWIFQEVEE